MSAMRLRIVIYLTNLWHDLHLWAHSCLSGLQYVQRDVIPFCMMFALSPLHAYLFDIWHVGSALSVYAMSSDGS